MDWILLFKALCLVLVIEGIPLFASPTTLRRAAWMLVRMDDRTLRTIGLVAMSCGALFLFLLK